VRISNGAFRVLNLSLGISRHEKFVRDFVAAWNKVMNLDRYALLAQARNGRQSAVGASR